MSSHVIFFSGHNMCSLFILLELVCVPFNVFSFFFLERDIFSVLINCFWRTNKEHSQQHIPHWHGYIHVNWYSTILSLCTQRNGTPWELWPILVKYCRDKMLHADEEGRKQSWKKMKIQNVFTQSQAKYGQHSRIMASGLVTGVGRLMMGTLFGCSSVCCVCMGFLFVSVSLPSVSAALSSHITGSESSSGGFWEIDLDLIAHSSGDRLLIGHVTCVIFSVCIIQLPLYSYVLSVFV